MVRFQSPLNEHQFWSPEHVSSDFSKLYIYYVEAIQKSKVLTNCLQILYKISFCNNYILDKFVKKHYPIIFTSFFVGRRGGVLSKLWFLGPKGVFQGKLNSMVEKFESEFKLIFYFLTRRWSYIIYNGKIVSADNISALPLPTIINYTTLLA